MPASSMVGCSSTVSPALAHLGPPNVGFSCRLAWRGPGCKPGAWQVGLSAANASWTAVASRISCARISLAGYLIVSDRGPLRGTSLAQTTCQFGFQRRTGRGRESKERRNYPRPCSGWSFGRRNDCLVAVVRYAEHRWFAPKRGYDFTGQLRRESEEHGCVDVYGRKRVELGESLRLRARVDAFHVPHDVSWRPGVGLPYQRSWVWARGVARARRRRGGYCRGQHRNGLRVTAQKTYENDRHCDCGPRASVHRAPQKYQRVRKARRIVSHFQYTRYWCRNHWRCRHSTMNAPRFLASVQRLADQRPAEGRSVCIGLLGASTRTSTMASLSMAAHPRASRLPLFASSACQHR